MGVRGGHKQLSVVCVARHVMCGVQGRELYYKLRILRQFSLKNVNIGKPKEIILRKGLVSFKGGIHEIGNT